MEEILKTIRAARHDQEIEEARRQRALEEEGRARELAALNKWLSEISLELEERLQYLYEAVLKGRHIKEKLSYSHPAHVPLVDVHKSQGWSTLNARCQQLGLRLGIRRSDPLYKYFVEIFY